VESEVLAAMQAHVAARMNDDVDAVVSSYSDQWTDDKGFTKRTQKDWHIASAVGDAKLEITIDLRTVDILVNGDEATFSPVRTDTAKGRTTQKHQLRKEADGVWRIVYSQVVDWETGPMDDASQARKDAIDATAMIVRAHREQLLNDRWRPGYHFVAPEGVAMPFDPNGAIFWQGRYHLFYIFQDKRLGKKSDHWGHVSSTDLCHWRHHPTGLVEGMYSGNCFLNENGVPTICYHQVGQGNALAVALDDNLDDWEKLAANPITPPRRAMLRVRSAIDLGIPLRGMKTGITTRFSVVSILPLPNPPPWTASGATLATCLLMASTGFASMKMSPVRNCFGWGIRTYCSVSAIGWAAATMLASGKTSSSILKLTGK
jgi:hypothetical protein